MSKRDISFLIRLNESENMHLKKQIEISGLSREQLIRNLISGVSLTPKPSALLIDILRQLAAIGNNINQIARVANSTSQIHQEDIESIKSMQSDIWHKIKGL